MSLRCCDASLRRKPATQACIFVPVISVGKRTKKRGSGVVAQWGSEQWRMIRARNRSCKQSPSRAAHAWVFSLS